MTFASPWCTTHSVEPARAYLAILSSLPLKRYRMIPQFVRHADRVRDQLATTPGVIGYSFNADPFRKRFWTLSVWETEGALRAFVGGGFHAQVMGLLDGEMGETRFTRWTVSGKDLPLSWKDAFTREKAHSSLSPA